MQGRKHSRSRAPRSSARVHPPAPSGVNFAPIVDARPSRGERAMVEFERRRRGRRMERGGRSPLAHDGGTSFPLERAR